MGLSSYLLIGHWYTRDTAANAAKKAFICNRVGDFGFLIGILTLWALTNTLDFSLMEIPAGISENLLNITVLCLFCGRWANPPNSRCTSGFRTPWKAPPRLRPDPCGHHGSRRRL